MKVHYLFIPVLTVFLSCGERKSEDTFEVTPVLPLRTVADIPAPEGYIIDQFPENSFSRFIQSLPLKDGPVISDYTGKRVINPIYRVMAVVDLPLLFNSDLEQCADFSMRIWADFHLKTGRMDSLYLFNYDGKKQYFNKEHDTYRTFLKRAFSVSNSHSLKMGCRKIEPARLKPGDLIVQNDDGGIGHVSMIMNSARRSTGEVLYLVGFSFMPAQEFHIENAMKYGTSGWFGAEGYVTFLKNHLDLGVPVFRRFE